MFSIQTLETRWFFQGQISASVHAWFSSLGKGQPPIPPSPRTDYYLWIDGDNLGIKLREGRFEAKQRRAAREGYVFHPHAVGIVEHWVKWSFPLGEFPFLPVQQDAQWIGITKERWLYYFSVSEQGKIHLVSADEDVPACGGGVELTKVSVQDSPQLWWTVGLEVFGEGKQDHILETIAAYAFSRDTVPHLPVENSCGYPRWLQVFETGVGEKRVNADEEKEN